MKIRTFFNYLFLVFIALYTTNLQAQQTENQIQWLAKGSYFEPVILDPTACITSGGLMRLKEMNDMNKGIYIPVNIGFQQSIFRFQKTDNMGVEFGFGAAAFTQFVIKEVESNTYLGEIENTDFKASGFINFLFDKWAARLRLFHISSHLADDYILRNKITSPNPGTVNYEQLDLTTSYQGQFMRYYLGLGTVITPHAVRERLSMQTGMYFRKKAGDNEALRLAAGMDVKIFEQNNYRPNIKSAVGVELGTTDKTHLGIFMEYYNGHLPYSTLEYKIVQWIGISAYLIPAWR